MPSDINAPKQYHTLLILLHWLLAILIILMLVVGTFSLKTMPNSVPEKIMALRIHMINGAAILLLTLLRVGVRLMTKHPAPARTGNALLDFLAQAMHWAFYILILLMAGSGIGISIQAGLPDILFNGIGSLPVNFDACPPRLVHGVIASLLIVLISLHAAAALFHQFFLRDRLLARMGVGDNPG